MRLPILLALCSLLAAFATSARAQSGVCEWRFNVGDHLLSSKDRSYLGVVVRRVDKHKYPSGATACAYIIRQDGFDDARPPSVLNEVAKVGTPPAAPECKWRFNVGDLLVFTKDGSELGTVLRREPKHRFPNGVVGCAYFIQSGSDIVQKFDRAALERIVTSAR